MVAYPSMLSRWAITRKLLFAPWYWIGVTLWTVFSHGTTIRDNFLPVERRANFQVLDHLPDLAVVDVDHRPVAAH